jgi:hypothetical protein
MTVSSTTSRVNYTGSGGTGPFAIPFYFLDDADIRAITVLIADGTETELTVNVDFTLTGAGEAAGGELTLTDSLEATHTLVIFRDPSVLQETDWPVADPFPAESHERAADRLVMIAQRLTSLYNRAVRQPDGDTADIDSLPAKVSRASKYLAFDADGNPVATAGTSSDLVATPFAETLLDDANAATARTTLELGTMATQAASAVAITGGTISDATTVVDPADATKQARLDAGGVTAGQTRVITVADQNFTIGKIPTIQTFTSSGTWTKPAACIGALVKCQAPGGGGGGADSDGTGNGAGGGGGAGGYAEKVILGADLGATETVTIGAVGDAGANTGTTGGTGGTTSFGAHVSCTGGVGGGGVAATLATHTRTGGAGGAGSSGTFNTVGGDGGDGFGTTNIALGGIGGSSYFGSGGRGAAGTSFSAGADGNDYGGGGGGAACVGSTTGAAGGAGGPGIIVVYEFY